MGFIYKIVNNINGKIYVGQTTKTLLEERFKEHRKPTSNCRYLLNAFKKYGIYNFEFIMIRNCLNYELNALEIMNISLHKSLVPNGYNLRQGGIGGGKHNEETKKKISETLKGRTDIKRGCCVGRHHTEETKNKISEALKGTHCTEETKKKMSVNMTGKHHTKESKNKMRLSNKTQIPVNQYNLDGIFVKQFASVSEASRQTNITRTSIGKCCNNIRKTAGGSVWNHSHENTTLQPNSLRIVNA